MTAAWCQGLFPPHQTIITSARDFTTGVNADLGLQSQVRLPNGGVVALDAGRVLSLDDGTVLFAAGRHDFLSGDLQAYCAAFAQ